MKKYLYLQLKRQIKLLPLVLIVTFVLFSGISVILTRAINSFNNDEEQQTLKVALTGDTEGDYIELGLTALQTLDDVRFTMELSVMEEQQAEELLKKGNLSAYVVLPENFINNALAGKMDKIRFVTTAGDRGITTMLKNELTTVITDIVVYSQKGTYGLMDAFEDLDPYHDDRWDLMDQMSLEYVDLILHRDDMIDTETAGVADGLTLPQYYLCGLTVLLMMLIGIPFASVCIRKDSSMERLLLSRGFSLKRQLACEYLSHFLILTASALFMTLCVRFMPNIASLIGDSELIANLTAPFIVRIVLSATLLSALNVFIFELAGDIVSGILLHFFTTLSLTYLSGCFYPIYSFPVAIQKLAPHLPSGVLRSFMAGIFTDEVSVGASILKILVYTAVLLTASLAVRRNKVMSNRG